MPYLPLPPLGHTVHRYQAAPGGVFRQSYTVTRYAPLGLLGYIVMGYWLPDQGPAVVIPHAYEQRMHAADWYRLAEGLDLEPVRLAGMN